MAVTVPNTFAAGEVIDPTKVNTNFSTVAAAMDNLVNANFTGSAGITNANLATSDFEVVISGQAGGTEMAVASAGEYIMVIPLPYEAGVDYTVKSISWGFVDISAGNAVFDIKVWYGAPAGSVDQFGGTGSVSDTSAGVLSGVSGTVTPTSGKVFLVEYDAETATPAAGDILGVSIKLTKALR